MALSPLDIFVFGFYFVLILGVGIFVLKFQKHRDSEAYFLAGRSLPWWVVGASLIASNISAEQFIGMSGSGFAGGLAIASYEWLAAVTLLLVGKYFLPIFLEKQIYTMPEFLELRFDHSVRTGLALFWLLVYVFVNLTSVMYLYFLVMVNFISSVPHRRLNALTGDFVLVSPHRAKRPWLGKVEALSEKARPAYDSSCYLCPNNLRANGERNPTYEDVYVFDNDFSVLLPDAPAQTFSNKTIERPLLHAEAVQGRCRVLCFSPQHNLTLAEMSHAQIARVVTAWQQETETLGNSYQWVQVFENKGDLMGCSNPHPHEQIWALNALPNEARKEVERQQSYFQTHQPFEHAMAFCLNLFRVRRVASISSASIRITTTAL